MAKSLFRVMNPPANRSELKTLCMACGDLPPSYLQFLTASNGAESCVNDIGGDCLALWSCSEIPEMNEAYQIARYVPELLVIGSDGGDCAIGFDRKGMSVSESWPVVRIGFGNLDRSDFVSLASGFRVWQAGGFRLVK